MNVLKTPKRIPEIYGTAIAFGLIVYFLIMRMLGIAHITELRFLNLAILGTAVYFALKQFRQTHDGSLNYFRALVIGLAASFIGVSTFVLFLFIYFKIDVGFFEMLKETESIGQYLNPYIATFAVWVEGIFSGFMVTFMLINYLETDNATQV